MSRREALLGTFRDAGRGRVSRIEGMWVRHQRAPLDPEAIAVLRREAHTLKGEARMMGFAVLGTAVHHLEDLLEAALATGSDGPAVLPCIDRIRGLLEAPPAPPEALAQGWADFVADAAAPPPGSKPAGAVPPDDAPPAAPEPTSSAATTESGPVRVQPVDLDRVAAIVGRLARRQRDRVSHLNGLRASVLRGESGVLEALDPALRALADEVGQDRLLLDELQGHVKRLRYRTLSEVFDTLPRVVHDVTTTRGKEARLVCEGGAVSVDGSVLDRLVEPLQHLVRNAVDHGLEAPELRRSRGKSPVGTVRVVARTEGQACRITVSDDGGGLDLEALGAAAVAASLVNEDELASLSRDAVAALAFRPTLSTRRERDALSGRGVGLSAVRDALTELRGKVSLHLPEEGGTRFEIEVPLTTLIADLMVCRVAGLVVAFDASTVRALLHLEARDVHATPHGPMFLLGDRQVPLTDLGLLLERGRALPAERLPVLVLEADGVLVGLGVEAFVAQRRLLVRPLGPLASGYGAIRAAALPEEGGVALVPDPGALAREAVQRARWSGGTPGERRSHQILVVDDSEFTRDLLAGLLRDMGHVVREAANGALGLASFREARPDLVFTDLDMPVLDGFGLLEALAADGSSVPVCVVSTHRARDTVERALQLGAKAYLVKSEFDDERLARTLERLVSS